jgi:DNA-binding transcriptional ArsR family regulator
MNSALSKTLQALSDPTRREIMRMLNNGDLSAGDIASKFNISMPSVSHHLGVLKNAEIVQARRQGQSIIYSMNATVVQEFLQELMDLLNIQPKQTITREEMTDENK